MDYQNVPQFNLVTNSNPKETENIAALVKSASSGNSKISRIWYYQAEPTFLMRPEHAGIAIATMAILSGSLALVTTRDIKLTLAWLIAAGLSVGFLFIRLLFSQNKSTEFEVEYSDTTTNKKSVEIAVKNGTNTQFLSMPEWFGVGDMIALAELADNDGWRFNRRTLEAGEICTQAQYPELRDAMIKANMLRKDGKSVELTDMFFEAVSQL